MIIFDFDGVLIDSVVEVAISGYNFATSSRVASTAELPPCYLDLFRANQHLIVNASRIGFIARWCLDHLEAGGLPTKTISGAEFLAYVESKGGARPELADEFYVIRSWFMNTHTAEWLLANPPFAEIWKAFLKLDPESFVLLTAKNRAAVTRISSHYGVELMQDRVYTGDGGISKTQNLHRIDALFGAEKYLFLDDAIENFHTLAPVLPGRLTPILAEWGYGAAEDKDSARRNGMEVLSQEAFVNRYLAS